MFGTISVPGSARSYGGELILQQNQLAHMRYPNQFKGRLRLSQNTEL